MSQVKEIRIDQMPAPTWNWLRLNDHQVKFPADGTAAAPVMDKPKGISVSGDASGVSAVETGAGKEFDEIASLADMIVFKNETGAEGNDPIRLKFSFADGQNGINRYGLVVEENSTMTVVMDFKSDADAAGYAGVQTRALVKKNGLLRLVQVHRLGDSFTCIDDIGALAEEKARVEIIHVIFSGRETDIGCRVTLKGDNSTYDAQIGYLAEKNHRIDLNYTIPQLGKHTASNVNVVGVLRDSAFKIFRGTIDFVRGSSGSTGDENENVLLMDDNVVNQSVPVILCDEEDVEGNHGASVGKLSEDFLFYLESRGIPFEDIYEMMAKARLESVFRRIPDTQTVDELAEYNETK